MLRSGSVAFLVFFLQSLLLPFPLYALPLQARQANGPSRTVTTVQTTDSPLGPVTVTCVLVFTPVKDAQGQDVVQEVKTCTLAMGASRSGSEPPTTSTTTSTISPSPSLITTTPSTTTTSTSNSTVSSSVTKSTTAPTPNTPTTPEVPPLGADAQTPTPSVQTSAVSGVSAASDVQLPGKKLSVLPIGLGVFAGISVIALIVVGLVTYERTKYRKAFRQRKLAESGAEMGYGGMAS